ncbi:metallophosphoesterase family protein [Metabacillus sp. B2-18]|uniref:metallophosphoesterase family protein n=1 Tax=Metabacillus sp. B2-18 TaxID=2897333 RepID=UPI001E2AD89E|nr:DNA repair exonuclease [Metabacillus sp. B2-18]UGB31613.1 DNA repair exonuclease [Metabacillus sp. B2-18]
MSSIKFIHAADLHLDSPFIGLKHMPSNLFERVRESTFLAFSRMISLAIKRKVDFLLLSGDLYDEDERSLKAQLKLKREFERLEQAGIQVYIIHGNHDHMSGKWIDLKWPENVHVFSSHSVEMKEYRKNDIPLAYIYGYSYPTRSLQENITSQYIKKENPSVYHIGMLHGSIEGSQEHDVYCPFKLHELIDKEFNYWALGHIHKRQILYENHQVVAYSGNIQGRHRKETGEKGCYLVELEEGETKSTFVSTEEILWEDVEISIDGLHHFSELLNKCETAIEYIQKKAQPTCLTIALTGAGSLANTLQQQDIAQDIIDIFNERAEEQENFVWIVKLINKTYKKRIDAPKLSTFYTDLQKTVDDYHSFEEVINPLIKHPVYRKYFKEYTLEEQKQLLKKAEKLLQNELLQQGEIK